MIKCTLELRYIGFICMVIRTQAYIDSKIWINKHTPGINYININPFSNNEQSIKACYMMLQASAIHNLHIIRMFLFSLNSGAKQELEKSHLRMQKFEEILSTGKQEVRTEDA